MRGAGFLFLRRRASRSCWLRLSTSEGIEHDAHHQERVVDDPWLRDFRKGTFKVELNVNQFRYAQETKDRVIALRKEGFSWSELSKATGVNMSTCRQWYAQFLKECEPEEPD